MLFDKVKEIKNKDHYLAKSSIMYDIYLNGLNELLIKLSKLINNKEISEIIEKKLQIKLEKFNEDQYIQAACELTAMSAYIGKEGVDFVYESKITPPKDVDFSITIDGRRYNVEVKCASFKEENKSTDVVKVEFFNRAPTPEIKNVIGGKIKSTLDKKGKCIEEVKNLDNTLKDFLESAQKKFKNGKPTDTNVLLICCKNSVDMQKWRGYLFGHNGFFTETSPVEHEEFNKVDFVLLTNIYNRHFRFFCNLQINNHWELSSSFNLLYPNKYSLRNKNIDVKKEIEVANKVFSNHSIEFEKYMENKSDVPIGEDFCTKIFLGVTWFSDKYKRNGIYYFS